MRFGVAEQGLKIGDLSVMMNGFHDRKRHRAHFGHLGESQIHFAGQVVVAERKQ